MESTVESMVTTSLHRSKSRCSGRDNRSEHHRIGRLNLSMLHLSPRFGRYEDMRDLLAGAERAVQNCPGEHEACPHIHVPLFLTSPLLGQRGTAEQV